MISFPTLEEALELHKAIIKQFGGPPEVIDLGLLESALFRPQTGYYEALFSMAAALMESLILNHPFVDGNKRVAFFLTDVFLRMNGYKIKTTPKQGHQFIIKIIEEKKRDLNKMEKWLQNHTEKLQSLL